MKTHADSIEIRLGGVGGQGIALAGTLLGKAAALHDGKEAVFTQTYGPEARGGASRADVIVGKRQIAYPFVKQPDILAVLFQEAYEKFRPEMKPQGLLIMESDLVNPRDEDADGIRLPAIEVARELGNKMAANIVMLGYIVGATGVVSREAMEASIRESVRPAHLELDLNALDAGFNMAASKRDD